jgi:hypothetical protein
MFPAIPSTISTILGRFGQSGTHTKSYYLFQSLFGAFASFGRLFSTINRATCLAVGRFTCRRAEGSPDEDGEHESPCSIGYVSLEPLTQFHPNALSTSGSVHTNSAAVKRHAMPELSA